MGATVGSESSESSRNIELNVVPFIDLMSCLTAFLLVTAVWSNFAQLPVEPAGLGQEGTIQEGIELKAAILIVDRAVYVGITVGGRSHRLEDASGRRNWDGLATVLDSYDELPELKREPVQIAAADSVPYQDMVTAMDLVREAGYSIAVTDPNSLEVRFHE